MIVALINPKNRDFYRRTKEDEEIIEKLIFKRTEALGRYDAYPKDIKIWAHAWNNLFRDYCHLLPWLSELERHGSLSIRSE